MKNLLRDFSARRFNFERVRTPAPHTHLISAGLENLQHDNTYLPSDKFLAKHLLPVLGGLLVFVAAGKIVSLRIPKRKK